MKRNWIVLGVYTALIFGCCIGFTYIWGNLPLLLENSVAGWRFFRGLNWFLKLFLHLIKIPWKEWESTKSGRVFLKFIFSQWTDTQKA